MRLFRGLVWVLVVAVSGWGAVRAQTNHTVRPGETLDGIGKLYGVTAASLIRENTLENPHLIRPGLVLKVPESTNAPRRYEVKSGDTLGSIALAHGTTVTALTERNQIKDPKALRPGQMLEIPPGGKSGSPSAQERHPLPSDIRRALESQRVTAGKWRYIVIHHSASPNGSLQSMDMYHRQKRNMENGLAYHFVIGNGRGMPDGRIEIGDRWRRQIKGGHLASDELNEKAIGICLVGNFEVDKPTAAQMQSLYALVGYLSARCGIPKSRVQTHKQINTKPTACPGTLFPTQMLLNNL
ncbi:MAG TPA: LysM peptidoglycan-binding domain-containing protein [Kiritimatiellia bacterium]|nr:LysM peptidoglycan-binding domain-containing protein [Kiritimatiellia bacterium]HMO98084.1 LysM peptidoglycan-binding domain-containing protein [Kiritimatiellia bacterium]HMP97359.1 LysM peptidoglycan-binding domain-containing protein [Kiritimatiellia bacterium]